LRFCDAEQPNAFSLRVADQVDAFLLQNHPAQIAQRRRQPASHLGVAV
jgi:hypothetical protein